MAKGEAKRLAKRPAKRDYKQFLDEKLITQKACGFDADGLNPMLFDFQRDIVRWALKLGRAAVFADCGMGKTPMQLEWASRVASHTNKPVLILAPLAVSHQTEREGQKFGIPVTVCKEGGDVRAGVNVTNYEKLHHFAGGEFGGIVLDESSILKAYSGKTRNEIIARFSQTPYRLACTATPAPNDYMELGNHAEFLGVMNRVEMLSMFFVHDGGDTSKWRLKGHAESEFWKWLCGWAVMLRKPSDLGYSDEGFELPPLNIHSRVVESNKPLTGMLWPEEAKTLLERRRVRRDSLSERARLCAELANADREPWLVWCDLNAEGDMLEKLIPDAVQVKGSDTDDHKEKSILDFAAGTARVLVTKPTIAGHGMNFQHCANVAFVGLSDSWEQYYQAVRRCWRFGQTRPVECHVITSEGEGAVVRNIQRKERDAERMQEEMVKHMSDLNRENLRGTQRDESIYRADTKRGDAWTMHLGDCVEAVASLEADSIDYSIFSPPFASLYTYSNSSRDMGNSKTEGEFFGHFKFLVKELHRVMRSGRLLSFHCMNLPTTKERDGVIGISDFRGELIRMFREAGFIYHSEVCIWKDPVTAMQRTKAIGLLYKQLKKDSCMSRQGIPDYLVTMRKAGVNPDPVTKTPDDFPVALWQRYASPVWMDINPSNTLQKESAGEEKDERHICPLQLEVIERAVRLWTNPNDLVLSPFAGIGSEGYVAIKQGRRFVGVELKESYFNQAVANLKRAEHEALSGSLFELLDDAEACVATQ